MCSLFCQQLYNILDTKSNTLFARSHYIATAATTNKQMVYGVLKALEISLHGTVKSEQHVNIIL
jgi:hypothetical protein